MSKLDYFKMKRSEWFLPLHIDQPNNIIYGKLPGIMRLQDIKMQLQKKSGTIQIKNVEYLWNITSQRDMNQKQFIVFFNWTKYGQFYHQLNKQKSVQLLGLSLNRKLSKIYFYKFRTKVIQNFSIAQQTFEKVKNFFSFGQAKISHYLQIRKIYEAMCTQQYRELINEQDCKIVFTIPTRIWHIINQKKKLQIQTKKLFRVGNYLFDSLLSILKSGYTENKHLQILLYRQLIQKYNKSSGYEEIWKWRQQIQNKVDFYNFLISFNKIKQKNGIKQIYSPRVQIFGQQWFNQSIKKSLFPIFQPRIIQIYQCKNFQFLQYFYKTDHQCLIIIDQSSSQILKIF